MELINKAILNYKAGQDGLSFLTLMLTITLPLVLIEEFEHTTSLPALIVVVAVTFVVQLGWVRTLQLFPWRDLSRWDRKLISNETSREKPHALWPRVHPWEDMESEKLLNARQVLYVALVWGWTAANVTYCAQFLNPDDSNLAWNTKIPGLLEFGLLISAMAVVVLALFRWLRYTRACLRPLSLWARFRTGYWVCAEYDRVFLAPVAIVIAAAFVSAASYLLSLPAPLAAFLVTSSAAAIAFGMGPSLAEWRLTGGYRMSISPPSLNSRNGSSTPSAANRS